MDFDVRFLGFKVLCYSHVCSIFTIELYIKSRVCLQAENDCTWYPVERIGVSVCRVGDVQKIKASVR